MSPILAVLLVGLMVSIFFVVAMILLIIVPSHMKKKQAQCIVPVPAVIVDAVMEYNTTNGSHVGKVPNYAPVYEFVWNGMTYRKKSTLNSSKRPVIGAQVMLYMDPNNIDRFYDPIEYERALRIFKIVGIAMLITGVFGACLGFVVVLSLFM